MGRPKKILEQAAPAANSNGNGKQVEDVRIENMNNLVDVLIDEINLLRRGQVTPSRANAMANLNGKIMQAVKLSIETNKYVQKLDQQAGDIPLVMHTQRQIKKLESVTA